MEPAGLLKFLFGIDTMTSMPRHHGPRTHEPRFRLPFPALSSISVTRSLPRLPVPTVKEMLRVSLEGGVRNIDLYETIAGVNQHGSGVKDILAYLGTLLPSLPPTVSFSEERPLKINLHHWGCNYRNDPEFKALKNDLPPGCDVVLSYEPVRTVLGVTM